MNIKKKKTACMYFKYVVYQFEWIKGLVRGDFVHSVKRGM